MKASQIFVMITNLTAYLRGYMALTSFGCVVKGSLVSLYTFPDFRKKMSWFLDENIRYDHWLYTNTRKIHDPNKHDTRSSKIHEYSLHEKFMQVTIHCKMATKKTIKNICFFQWCFKHVFFLMFKTRVCFKLNLKSDTGKFGYLLITQTDQMYPADF